MLDETNPVNTDALDVGLKYIPLGWLFFNPGSDRLKQIDQMEQIKCNAQSAKSFNLLQSGSDRL